MEQNVRALTQTLLSCNPMSYWLVPQGAEFKAVQTGLKRSSFGGCLISMPLGSLPLEPWLTAIQAQSSLPSPIVLLWGLAGSLSPDLRVGDVVLSDRFYTFAGEVLQGDGSILNTLREILPEAKVSPALTSDRIIGQVAEKQALGQTYPCHLVEMEGAIVAQALAAHRIPFAMIRVISDDLSHDLPDLGAALRPDGHLNALALTGTFLSNPIGAFHLVRGALQGLAQLKTIAYRVACSAHF